MNGVHIPSDMAVDGFVYALSSGPFVKIGRGREADKRIKSLKIQLPFPVEVVNVIPCNDPQTAEKTLHNLFGQWRENGEWFALNPDQVHILEHIDRCYTIDEGTVLGGDWMWT